MGKIIKTSMKVFYRRMADFLCLASSLHVLLFVFLDMFKHDIAAEVYRQISVAGFVFALVFMAMSWFTKK